MDDGSGSIEILVLLPLVKINRYWLWPMYREMVVMDLGTYGRIFSYLIDLNVGDCWVSRDGEAQANEEVMSAKKQQRSATRAGDYVALTGTFIGQVILVSSGRLVKCKVVAYD